MMATSAIVKTNVDGQLVLKDGTAVTPLSITIPFENGDIAISALKALQRAATAYQSRARLVALRNGALEFPTISFSAMFSCFTSAQKDCVMDAIRKTGAWAAAVSTSAALGDVYTLDATFTIAGEDLGDSADHVITLTKVALDVAFGEGEPDNLTCNGTIYGSVTAT